MKIIINGRFLSQSPSGVQNYAMGIAQALQASMPDVEIVCPPLLHTSHNLKTKTIGSGSGFVWEQWHLARYMRKQKNAILINLCNAAPLFVSHQIVTIHDLAYEQRHVHWFTFAFRWWYRFLIPRLAKKAKLIFTVSHFSQKELMTHYGCHESKIKIIPNGLPVIRFATPPPIEGHYLLLTAANNPRKNAAWVINQLETINRNGYKLVVLGSSASVFGKVNLKTHASILFFENVDTAVYHSLIKNASALVFPSLYEGFGIPILESIVIGTPVIASHLDVFRESFQQVPIYFELQNQKSFENALIELKNKKIERKDIDSLQNKFNFEVSNQLLTEYLNEVINENSISTRLV